MVTEIKEQTFAFTTLELARGLVVMPNDSSEVVKAKRDRGFCVDGWQLRLVVELAEGFSLRYGSDGKRFLLSAGFKQLLALVANEESVLGEMELTDKEIRASLFCGAEAVITEQKRFIAGYELGVPIRVREASGEVVVKQPCEVEIGVCRGVVEVLQRFQENLLQRISHPLQDIRNR